MEAETTRSEPWQVSNVTGRNGTLSPVQKILSVNEHGLVFRSSKPFELCSELALGLHIARQRIPGTRFLNVSGFVVKCESDPDAGRPTDYGSHYHVTLVFDHIEEEDRDLLRRICAQKEATSTAATPALQPRKFGELGLN